MKNKLPWDIKQECLWIVRGYDRRTKQYIAWRQEVIESGGANYVTYVQDGEECRAYMPRGNQTSHIVEDKQLRLEAIEHYPEVIKMRAVEHAKLRIGLDLLNEESRQRLTSGILLNCESGRDYPFEYLNLPEFSRMDFYRRKDNFLYDVAKFLKMT